VLELCWNCVLLSLCKKRGGREGLLSSTENSSHVVGNHVITSLDRSTKHGSFDCSTKVDDVDR
jgi:hypothetical protein